MNLASSGFRDMTRIASSPFEMWNDIFRTNDDAVKEAVDTFIDHLKKIRNCIGTQELGVNFKEANLARAIIPKDSKGFLRTLYDVLVVVEDKPGELAQISGKLYDYFLGLQYLFLLLLFLGNHNFDLRHC